MVHRRDVENKVLIFGNQGALWRNAMTWWDHETGSVWSQPLGEALAGPRKGQRLELFPSELTTWGAWKAGHPETIALEAPGVATGFDLQDLWIVVDFTDEVTAYPVTDLREVGVANDVVNGVPIAVVSDPGDPELWAVFSRQVGGGDVSDAVVDLVVDGEVLRDRISGSTFDPILGIGLSGDLTGEFLDKLPALTTYPGGPIDDPSIYRDFWPDGTIWQPGG